MKNRPFLLSACVLLLLFFPHPGRPQSEEQKIEAAKKEGILYWYGSMSNDDATALIAGITKKYPFIQIRRFRGGNSVVLSKLEAEARARSLTVDVIDVDGFYVWQLLKRNYYAPYRSPELAAYPKQLTDLKALWAGFFLLPHVVVYNTKLVRQEDAPRSYRDLLEPKWKGKMAIPDSGVTWFHGMLQYMGREKGRSYMKQLAGQNVHVQSGNRMMVELTMAGEHVLGIAAYSHRIGQFQRKGAPMGWMKDDVIVTTPQAIGISGLGKAANSAKLIVDFVFSPEGQAILRKSGRIPASSRVDPDPAELTKGRKLFYSDIIDGGSRYNELNEEFNRTFGIR
ncbi:MAG: extracellular solute-binding protein [Deltaproteobacteria bacterium]|nr:extracellular solute-binding protein [Deltaproteobacteria bacterium]